MTDVDDELILIEVATRFIFKNVFAVAKRAHSAGRHQWVIGARQRRIDIPDSQKVYGPGVDIAHRERGVARQLTLDAHNCLHRVWSLNVPGQLVN